MLETILLIGADEVRSAGNTIANAADSMRQTQNWQTEEMQRHRIFLDEWLARFEAVLERQLNAVGGKDE